MLTYHQESSNLIKDQLNQVIYRIQFSIIFLIKILKIIATRQSKYHLTQQRCQKGSNWVKSCFILQNNLKIHLIFECLMMVMMMT